MAGHGVVGVEESALGMIASADADDHFAVGDARRHGDGVLVLRIATRASQTGFPVSASSACRRPSMIGAMIMP